MSTQEIIDQAIALPPEERERIVELLVESLNVEQKAIDHNIATEIERRVEELKSGKVKGIPGDEVFAEIWKSFEK